MKGLLVVVAVLAAFAAIIVPIAHIVLSESAVDHDARSMRQIYVALSIYEQANDGLPAPSLLEVRRDLADDTLFRAANDPVYGGTFPLDPAVATGQRSPVRISYTYLGNWVRAGGAKIPPWSEARRDVRQGLISSYWFGDVGKNPPDGGIVRVNVDGSVTHLARRADPARLSYDDLFRRR